MAVVVVMGLPGSGKSTLCQRVTEALEASWQGEEGEQAKVDWETTSGLSRRECTAVVADFDELAPPSCEREDGDDSNATTPTATTTTWKEQRQRALQHVRSLLPHPEHIGDNGSEELRGEKDGAGPRIVLVDDTLHLRSMRRELFRIARQSRVGFGTIHVPTPVDVCCRRDAERPQPIGEAIIQDMASRLEPPAEPWENVLTLSVPDHNSASDQLEQKCVSFIARCCAAPLSPPVDDSTQKEAARAETARSLLHQCDLQLRRCVSDALRSSSTLTPQAKRKLVASLSSAKADILARLRSCGPNLQQRDCDTEVETFRGYARDVTKD